MAGLEVKNIHDIMTSELIVRQNNVNFTMEYLNISVENLPLIFPTKMKIHEVVYVTLNGTTLIKDIHYEVIRPNTVKVISIPAEAGSATDAGNMPMQVAYHYNLGAVVNITSVPPEIISFYTTPASGEDEPILLNFVINQNGAQLPIRWTISKAGRALSLFNGSGLITTDGVTQDTAGDSILLQYIVTEAEFLANPGGGLVFTLGVTYTMANGTGSGTVFAQADYLYTAASPPITGDIFITPQLFTEEGAITIDVDYIVDNPALVDYSWFLYQEIHYPSGVITTPVLLAQGTSDQSVSSSYADAWVVAPYADYDIHYKLYKLEASDSIGVFLAENVAEVDTGIDAPSGSVSVVPAAIRTANVATDIDIEYIIVNDGAISIVWSLTRAELGATTYPLVVATGTTSGAVSATATNTFTATEGQSTTYVYAIEVAIDGGTPRVLASDSLVIEVESEGVTSITTLPALIASTGPVTIQTNYAAQFTGVIFDYKVTAISVPAGRFSLDTSIVASGRVQSSVASFIVDSIDVLSDDAFERTYTLAIKLPGETVYSDYISSSATVAIGDIDITGTVEAAVPLVDSAGTTVIKIDYSLANLSGDTFEWRIRSQGVGRTPAIVVLASGTTSLTAVVAELPITFSTELGDSYTTEYLLESKSSVDAAYMLEDITSITVAVVAGTKAPLRGTIHAVPSILTGAVESAVSLVYEIVNDNLVTYDWKILRVQGLSYAVVVSGSGAVSLNSVFADTLTPSPGEESAYSYLLQVKEAGGEFVTLDTSPLTVDVSVSYIAAVITPSTVLISAAGSPSITLDTTITNAGALTLDWKVVQEGDPLNLTDQLENIIASGTSAATSIVDSTADAITVATEEDYTRVYYVKVKESAVDVEYQTYAVVNVVVNTLAVQIELGNTAYISAADMFISTGQGKIQLGSLGTAQDIVDYNANVDPALFMSPFPQVAGPIPVALAGGLTDGTPVYLIIRVLTSWGALSFTNGGGAIDAGLFNVVVLGTGDTAYIYTVPQIVGSLEVVELVV